MEQHKETLQEAFSFNVNWYRHRARINKYAHQTTRFLLIGLPALIVVLQTGRYQGYEGFTLWIGVLISFLSIGVSVVSPLVNWKKFKCAEIRIAALSLRFDVDYSGAVDSEQGGVIKEYTRKLEETLLAVAADYFMAYEDSTIDDSNPGQEV